MSEFRNGYSPGGMTGKAARRSRARYAGVRSGRKRRQLAHTRRGLPPGHPKMALAYELRYLARAEFDRRYEEVSPRPERPSAAIQWERKREAVWQHSVSACNLVRARGQHAGTTNGRRARGLANRGLERTTRSVRTYHRVLEAMAIAGFQHVRTPVGQRDYLRVEWRVHRRLRISPFRQPCGTGNTTDEVGVPRRSNPRAEPPDEPSRPPDAENGRAPTAPGTERGEVEAQIRFAQLKLDMNFGDPAAVRRRLRQLTDQLQAIPEPGSPPQPPGGSDD